MAGLLFQVLLAVLTLAAAAAGFVIHDFAVYLWALAAVLAVATVIAWRWERMASHVIPPSAGTRASTRGDHSPAIAIPGNQNTVNIGAIPTPAVPRAFDQLLDHRLKEGTALQQRLYDERISSFTVLNLLSDTRRWQERCVRTVDRCAGDRSALFKSKAGPFQPLMGQPGWLSGTNWRIPFETGLNRWIRALQDMHS